jgi:hypothetical protein
MLVIRLAKTKAVLAAATHTAAAVPAAADLVGTGLLARTTGLDISMTVPAEALEVKEADYTEDVFRRPLTFALDDSGNVLQVANVITGVGAGVGTVTVTLAATVTPDKAMLVVVDAGPNYPPQIASGKTPSGGGPVALPVSVPPGQHLVLASVDGFVTVIGDVPF